MTKAVKASKSGAGERTFAERKNNQKVLTKRLKKNASRKVRRRRIKELLHGDETSVRKIAQTVSSSAEPEAPAKEAPEKDASEEDAPEEDASEEDTS